MQALEKIGVLEQDEEKGGRRITQSGQRDLDRESDFLYVRIGVRVQNGGLRRRIEAVERVFSCGDDMS